MPPLASALRPRPRYDETFAADVIAGLGAVPKRLPSKYFYDRWGSQLFEQITRLPEYYPTRTEIGILEQNADSIAALIPKGAALVELGSGSATKVRILLEAAPQIAAYVPVDISADFLAAEALKLERDIPRVAVLPVAADFTRAFALPAAVRDRPRVGFFPGSTIGNFELHEAEAFLRQAAQVLGPGASLIIGADLVKDESVLDAAYNDAAGVTAQFNLNLLARINRELNGDFDRSAFRHHAFFHRERSRIEMHLVSTRPQSVHVCRHSFELQEQETIHTENSHKFTIESFRELATRAGWQPSTVFTDARSYFSVHVLTFA